MQGSRKYQNVQNFRLKTFACGESRQFPSYDSVNCDVECDISGLGDKILDRCLARMCMECCLEIIGVHHTQYDQCLIFFLSLSYKKMTYFLENNYMSTTWQCIETHVESHLPTEHAKDCISQSGKITSAIQVLPLSSWISNIRHDCQMPQNIGRSRCK